MARHRFGGPEKPMGCGVGWGIPDVCTAWWLGCACSDLLPRDRGADVYRVTAAIAERYYVVGDGEYGLARQSTVSPLPLPIVIVVELVVAATQNHRRRSPA